MITNEPGVAWPSRVLAWDAALSATRATLRAVGMREVSTPVRVCEVALEPWIEPIAASARWLATSPELGMKRLLCRGSGPIFQIAHVFRAAEIGAHHSEEFHLIEWYRTCEDPRVLEADVEAVVEAVMVAVAEAIAGESGVEVREPPQRWERVQLLDLLGDTLGTNLAGDEPLEAIKPYLDRVRAKAGIALLPGEYELDEVGREDGELARLLAWTELFSLWSDLYLDPWLASRGLGVGVHVVDFPAPLAALARIEGPIGRRFESHVGGVELANGYLELRDADQQRRRFEVVARMRAHNGLPALPVAQEFLASLEAPGLPGCVGVALGLDRLVALACGVDRLDQIALAT